MRRHIISALLTSASLISLNAFAHSHNVNARVGYSVMNGINMKQASNKASAPSSDVAGTAVFQAEYKAPLSEILSADVEVSYALPSDVQTTVNETSTVDTSLQTVRAFANVSASTTQNGLTAYVGGGLGAAYYTMSDVETNVEGQDSATPVVKGNSDLNFAYQLKTGVDYALSETLSVGAAFKYANLGKVSSAEFEAAEGQTLSEEEQKPMESAGDVTSSDFLFGATYKI